MIGAVVKTPGVGEPRFSKFAEIQKGDHVVYYATKDYIVVGIFKVVSDMEYLPNDPHWKEIMVYKTRPVELPVPEYYLDFKKLVTDPNVKFDVFKGKKHWGGPLQGKPCILLTEKDYLVIKDALSEKRYLKSIKEIEIETTYWHKKYGKD